MRSVGWTGIIFDRTGLGNIQKQDKKSYNLPGTLLSGLNNFCQLGYFRQIF